MPFPFFSANDDDESFKLLILSVFKPLLSLGLFLSHLKLIISWRMESKATFNPIKNSRSKVIEKTSHSFHPQNLFE